MEYRLKKLIASFRKFREAFVNYPFRKFNLVEILLFWLKERLNRSQFLVVSGILVGFSAGLAGDILKITVNRVQHFVNEDIPFKERIFVFALLPMFGIVLTVLVVKYFFKGKEDRVFSDLLIDISKNRSKIRKSKMYSQIIQSAITVGFGGSVGVETPNAITGSAIGSNYGQRYRLGFKERTLLLASGAAAGIATLFDAPVAGVMFAYEVLLLGLVFTDFIPLVIAAICGSLLSHVFFQEDSLFHFLRTDGFNYANTPYYLLLGLMTGFYARFYLVVGVRINKYFKRFKDRKIRAAFLGGGLLSLLCVIFPPLYGEGYLNILRLHEAGAESLVKESLFQFLGFSPWVIIVFLTLTIFVKAIATGLTLHSGGSGGNFAPSLVSGGLLGYLFGFVLQILGVSDIPLTNFMLVGMAGVMSGVWYAPLTGIFLIAEISKGYELFVPLMLVSVMAYLINKSYSKVNPNYAHLAERGEIFTTRQDQNLLVHIPITECLNPFTLKFQINDSLEDILTTTKNSNQNTAAVVDETGRFLGILDRVHLRPFLTNEKSSDDATVVELISEPASIITVDDTALEAIKMFEEADVWQLPLVDENKHFLGLVSRSAILKNYRALLREYSES